LIFKIGNGNFTTLEFPFQMLRVRLAFYKAEGFLEYGEGVGGGRFLLVITFRTVGFKDVMVPEPYKYT
jgi:hypothetical protein